jgi:hypothetical protein
VIDYSHSRLSESWERSLTSSEKTIVGSREDHLRRKYEDSLKELGESEFINTCLEFIDEFESPSDIKPLGKTITEYLATSYINDQKGDLEIDSFLLSSNPLPDFEIVMTDSGFQAHLENLQSLGAMLSAIDKVFWYRAELIREDKLNGLEGFHRDHVSYKESDVKKMYNELKSIDLIDCEPHVFMHFFYFDKNIKPSKPLTFIEWKGKSNALEYFIENVIKQSEGKGRDKFQIASEIFDRKIKRNRSGAPRKEIREVIDKLIPPK